MAAAAAHAVKSNRKLHPKDGNASQVPISLCTQNMALCQSSCGNVTKVPQFSSSLMIKGVINSPARNGWGETAQALHGEIAQV